MRKYYIQMTVGRKPICLPEGVSAQGFLDQSQIHEPWAKLFNPETGEMHDCEAYAQECEEQSAYEQLKQDIQSRP
jgi:hypothetical protein